VLAVRVSCAVVIWVLLGPVSVRVAGRNNNRIVWRAVGRYGSRCGLSLVKIVLYKWILCGVDSDSLGHLIGLQLFWIEPYLTVTLPTGIPILQEDTSMTVLVPRLSLRCQDNQIKLCD